MTDKTIGNSAIDSAIRSTANGNAKDLEYLHVMGLIESSLDVNAHNYNGSCVGLYQFDVGTASDMGMTAAERYDPKASAVGALKLRERNADYFESEIGRRPTSGESYLLHQQGIGGGTALVKRSDENALTVLTDVYGSEGRAKSAIIQNGGSVDMTAGEFADKWVNKYNDLAKSEGYNAAASSDKGASTNRAPAGNTTTTDTQATPVSNNNSKDEPGKKTDADFASIMEQMGMGDLGGIILMLAMALGGSASPETGSPTQIASNDDIPENARAQADTVAQNVNTSVDVSEDNGPEKPVTPDARAPASRSLNA